jgi:hypothetical protein
MRLLLERERTLRKEHLRRLIAEPSGGSISHETVARWRRRGWRPLERERHQG